MWWWQQLQSPALCLHFYVLVVAGQVSVGSGCVFSQPMRACRWGSEWRKQQNDDWTRVRTENTADATLRQSKGNLALVRRNGKQIKLALSSELCFLFCLFFIPISYFIKQPLPLLDLIISVVQRDYYWYYCYLSVKVFRWLLVLLLSATIYISSLLPQILANKYHIN